MEEYSMESNSNCSVFPHYYYYTNETESDLVSFTTKEGKLAWRAKTDGSLAVWWDTMFLVIILVSNCCVGWLRRRRRCSVRSTSNTSRSVTDVDEDAVHQEQEPQQPESSILVAPDSVATCMPTTATGLGLSTDTPSCVGGGTLHAVDSDQQPLQLLVHSSVTQPRRDGSFLEATTIRKKEPIDLFSTDKTRDSNDEDNNTDESNNTSSQVEEPNATNMETQMVAMTPLATKKSVSMIDATYTAPSTTTPAPTAPTILTVTDIERKPTPTVTNWMSPVVDIVSQVIAKETLENWVLRPTRIDFREHWKRGKEKAAAAKIERKEQITVTKAEQENVPPLNQAAIKATPFALPPDPPEAAVEWPKKVSPEVGSSTLEEKKNAVEDGFTGNDKTEDTESTDEGDDMDEDKKLPPRILAKRKADSHDDCGDRGDVGVLPLAIPPGLQVGVEDSVDTDGTEKDTAAKRKPEPTPPVRVKNPYWRQHKKVAKPILPRHMLVCPYCDKQVIEWNMYTFSNKSVAMTWLPVDAGGNITADLDVPNPGVESNGALIGLKAHITKRCGNSHGALPMIFQPVSSNDGDAVAALIKVKTQVSAAFRAGDGGGAKDSIPASNDSMEDRARKRLRLEGRARKRLRLEDRARKRRRLEDAKRADLYVELLDDDSDYASDSDFDSVDIGSVGGPPV